MAEKCELYPSDGASSTNQEDKSSGNNNWWDSWISSAKSRSAEVYTMVRKDLDEIKSAVKSEASHVFSSTSNVIGKTLKLDSPESTANVMKKSFSTFIGQVSTVLNPEPDDEDDTEVILSSGDTTMLSTYKTDFGHSGQSHQRLANYAGDIIVHKCVQTQKELEALQRVDATYIVPAYSPEFEAWRSSLENSESVITPASAMRRLETNPILKTEYEKLVPDAVSNEEFWERYLFRVALLQDRLAAASRKQPLEETTDDPVLAHLPLQTPIIEQSPKKVLSGVTTENNSETPEPDDSVVTWEDEDFANDVELTEEQQTLLLEEYEKEIASKKNKASRDVTNNNSRKDETETINKQINKTKSIGKKSKSRSPIKGKSDECGNNLVEDYFGDKDQVKDDASANSDESWEKEFEFEETVQQKA